MKKIKILFIILVTIFFIACSEENRMDNYIDIYSLNDFHGAIFEHEDEPGISKLGEFLIQQKNKRPDATLILSAGDMFQGTALSSITRGDIVVDAMNYIGFDAMTIGNHEFDWGIDEMRRFFDNECDNNEAEFPFLGANICYESSLERVEWAEPYTIVERKGIKIGIIGILGEDLINDILRSIIKDYVFTSQIEIIKKYTRILRSEKDCQIVIVASHSDTTPINVQIAYLPDEERVDAVINGHTHNFYAGEIYGEREVPLPYIQSGNNGKYIGNIRLYFNPETKEIIDVSCENLYAVEHCLQKNPAIDDIIDNYSDITSVANEILAVAGEDINRLQATVWAADVLHGFSDSEIGIINNGGIRAGAFPLAKDQTITYGNIFRIMPFENRVVIVELTGAQIKYLMSGAQILGLTFSSNIDINAGRINDTAINSNDYYQISTVDFVFEAVFFPTGQNIYYSDILFRDLLVSAVRTSSNNNDGKWCLH